MLFPEVLSLALAGCTCRGNRGFHKQRDGPNLIKRMVIRRLRQAWFSDITYILIKTSFIYLAAILDIYSQQMISYAVSTKLDTASHCILFGAC